MEISSIEQALLSAAREAAQNAYAPYSNFKVGAAVLTKSGKVFSGCNVENASYGLTICAERVALFKAVSEASSDIDVLALSSVGGVTPCGACRQVLAEFNAQLQVLIGDGEGKPVRRSSLADLLPHAFGSDFKQ